MATDWIATEWVRREDLDDHGLTPVKICRMRSPFYEGERWAVRQYGECLNVSGEWEYEPLPSSRDEAFYKRCRFLSFDEACAAAEAAIAKGG